MQTTSHTHRLFVLTGLVTLIGMPFQGASAITYIESIDGDLSGNLSQADNLGFVSSGINSVSGTLNFDYSDEFNPGDDADSFEFQVPDGLYVDRLSFSATNVIIMDDSGFRVRNFSGGTESFFFFNNYEDANIIDTPSERLEAGTYDLQVHGMSGMEMNTGSGSADWNVEMNVVPEPHTYALFFGLGAGVLVLLRRRL